MLAREKLAGRSGRAF